MSVTGTVHVCDGDSPCSNRDHLWAIQPCTELAGMQSDLDAKQACMTSFESRGCSTGCAHAGTSAPRGVLADFSKQAWDQLALRGLKRAS